nr:MAG TPA: hypothetical protein [Herelleviridae sp.]
MYFFYFDNLYLNININSSLIAMPSLKGDVR